MQFKKWLESTDIHESRFIKIAEVILSKLAILNKNTHDLSNEIKHQNDSSDSLSHSMRYHLSNIEGILDFVKQTCYHVDNSIKFLISRFHTEDKARSVENFSKQIVDLQSELKTSVLEVYYLTKDSLSKDYFVKLMDLVKIYQNISYLFNKLYESLLTIAGPQSGKVDWRPTETTPEDYYAL